MFQRLKSHLFIENIAPALVIFFGILLRVRQLTINLSLWLDEAMLALNIVNRSFARLAQPLDSDQGAPLGFLWTVKTFELVLGNREVSLRLFTFLMACLSLVILWLVAKQLIKSVGGVFALLILTTSRYLVSYGVQVKQYAVDVTITLLLYLLGLWILRKATTKRDYFILATLGGLSIWMSHPAVFTLAGIGLTLIISAALKKDWKSAISYSLASAFWALNFGILYLIQYRALGANSYLTGFWSEYFMPMSISAPLWAFDRLGGLFYNPGGLSIAVPATLLMILFLAGAISFFQRDRRWVWMFFLSLFFTLAASSLSKYPFGGRMGMFAVPGLLICMGEGIELVGKLVASLWRSVSKSLAWRPTIGFLVTALLAGSLAFEPVTFAVEMALKPKMAENIGPTMAFLKSNYREGDVIYLYHWATPAFRYYAPKYGIDKAKIVHGTDLHANMENYCIEVKQLSGNKRAWFLFSHLTDYEYLNERDTILDCAGQIGSKKREFSEPGTMINLFLYDLGNR
jgi:uncharacterized membrane protein